MKTLMSFGSACFAAYTVVAAVVTLLLLYNLSSYTSSHRQSRMLLGPSSSLKLKVKSTSSSGSAVSSKEGSIAQHLLSELTQGPTGSLLQQFILPLTNFSSLSAAQLPLLLQGTNFTTLSTAAVLDAAGSRLDSRQKWRLANLHQKLFCA